MDVHHLRHFLVAADLQNYRKAAEALGISQPGLSRSISVLEESVGAPLFKKVGRGIEITKYGLSLLPHAKVILSEVQRTKEELRSVYETDVGAVRMGANVVFSSFLLPEALKTAYDNNIASKIELVTERHELLIERLLTGDLDFLLLIAFPKPEDYDPNIVYESLFTYPSSIYCDKNHPLADSPYVNTEDLARYSWCSTGVSNHPSFIRFFIDNGCEKPRTILESTSVEILIRTVTGTDLLTILPDKLVQQHSRGKTLRRLNSEAPIGGQSGGIALRRGTIEGRDAAEKFIAIIRSLAG